jgi:hypothetical protein
MIPGITLRMLPLLLMLGGLPVLRSDQTFTVALPELEGPLTIGIFSPEGERVRLLHRDAPVDSLPAGLNGLILTWDEKDDAGNPLPPGVYEARGLVHGAVVADLVPFSLEPRFPFSDDEADPAAQALPDQGSVITLRAVKDELLTNRPLLSIRIGSDRGMPDLEAEDLPLAFLPSSPEANPVSITHGTREGLGVVTFTDPSGTFTRTVRGLDRIVPLHAGRLTVAPASGTD